MTPFPRTPEADMNLSKPLYSFTDAREKRRQRVRLGLYAIGMAAAFITGAML